MSSRVRKQATMQEADREVRTLLGIGQFMKRASLPRRIAICVNAETKRQGGMLDSTPMSGF